MEIGQHVQGYEIVRELGAGGMGAVYEARHITLGRRAAVKVLHSHFADDERFAFRFVNEGRASSIIGHPGVVEVHECGRLPDGAVYLIMELLAGETLGRRLRRVVRVGAEEALAVGCEVARVLAAAHARGVVHRDLKPDNVMLVPDGDGAVRVKVFDFGIARIAQEYIQTTAKDLLTKTGDVLGTPLYMAPEQCRGARHLDGKADVYALGVMLYRMLAGTPPYRGATLAELMMQHVTVEPPPLRVVAPEVPAVLAALVHRMLVKYPMQRPSADEVAREMAWQMGAAAPLARAPFDAGELARPFGATPDAATLVRPATVAVSADRDSSRWAHACEVLEGLAARNPTAARVVLALLWVAWLRFVGGAIWAIARVVLL